MTLELQGPTNAAAQSVTIPGVEVTAQAAGLSRGETGVLAALRRIRRTGKPGMLVIYVDSRAVSWRVCGPPERVTD